jgi:hypothetical protein
MMIEVTESMPPQTTTNEEPTHPRDAWTAGWGGLPEAAEMTGLPIDELMSEDPVGETQVAKWVDDIDQPIDPTITAEPGEPNPEGNKAAFHPPEAPANPDELSWGDPDPLDDSGALEAMALGDDQEDDEEDEEEGVRPITERMEAICGDMSALFQKMAKRLGIDVGVQDPTESRTVYLDRMLQSINDTDVRKDNMALDPGVPESGNSNYNPSANGLRLVPAGLLTTTSRMTSTTTGSSRRRPSDLVPARPLFGDLRLRVAGDRKPPQSRCNKADSGGVQPSTAWARGYMTAAGSRSCANPRAWPSSWRAIGNAKSSPSGSAVVAPTIRPD